MREIHTNDIISALERLFIEANTSLPENVYRSLEGAVEKEESPVGREVILELIKNADLARNEGIPVCQDTGLAVTFMEIGQDVCIKGGFLGDAVNEGVRKAYKNGYLRKSCCHPFTRKNTDDNTPAILHLKIVPGDRIKITVLPKGGGSENYGEVRMLLPSEGIGGVKSFVLEMVNKGGPNPCPPIFAGIGIGGNFETSALLSKEALMIPAGVRNNDPFLASLELAILEEINKTGIGPQGYGGTVTALDVHIKMLPCHIASLPVAVNIQCHAHRVKEIII